MRGLFYVWAESLDKAIIELARGRYSESAVIAYRKKHAVDKTLWTIRFTSESFSD